MKTLPQKIVCLTEESVEWLYYLEKNHLIAGISCFVKRPSKAALEKPIVSAFTGASLSKIREIQPDLVLGFSDIQKNIAKDLIGEGFNVFISNQRTITEIFDYLILLGSMVGARDQAIEYVEKQIKRLDQLKPLFKRKPKVYFEEWDEPMISAIAWVSELIEYCGGKPIFKEKTYAKMAQGRIVESSEVITANPDLILACWCGKDVDLDAIYQRPGWEKIKAVKNQQLYVVPPEVFLQPGPALFEAGIDQLIKIFQQWGEQSSID
jgi:iron complex transport system substrate-binding protein